MVGSLEDVLEGNLVFYAESGTEGGFWAFRDKNVEHFYKGLYVLESGDELTIYKDDEKIWDGILDFQYYPVFTQHALNYWIHCDQKGVNRDEWAMYFFKNYGAELILHGRERPFGFSC